MFTVNHKDPRETLIGHCPGVFIGNFEHCSKYLIVNFELVIASWVQYI